MPSSGAVAALALATAAARAAPRSVRLDGPERSPNSNASFLLLFDTGIDPPRFFDATRAVRTLSLRATRPPGASNMSLNATAPADMLAVALSSPPSPLLPLRVSLLDSMMPLTPRLLAPALSLPPHLPLRPLTRSPRSSSSPSSGLRASRRKDEEGDDEEERRVDIVATRRPVRRTSRKSEPRCRAWVGAWRARPLTSSSKRNEGESGPLGDPDGAAWCTKARGRIAMRRAVAYRVLGLRV